LNVIPHALRTPITTFRGLAEALPAATEAEIREQITPALRRLAAQAEHLLDDLLIAAGYTTALPTGPSVSLGVIETVEAVWADLGAPHPLDVDGDHSVTASTAEGVLFKIFVHVLDNAAKYGDDPRSVIVTSTGDRATVVVANGGDVVPEPGTLTEPFFRGEKAVMRSSGMGVGLTVATALAEQAHGSLTISCPPKGGLSVRIELPTT
jgi:K+-sensing histidine kinase KdpD